MPIYEYQCNACGHRFEKLQKLSADPIRDCPECAQAEVRKLISAAGFRLKGSGWYETDFKTGKKKNLAETTSNKTDDKKKTKAKTDKKPTPKSQD